MESLMKLLDERPLNHITVRDIVEDCGVNRNTFYYHFDDISSVIEAIILREVDGVMEDYRDISSMEECFEAAFRIGHQHRNAVYHIYNSSNRDFLERRLMEICKYVATQFVDKTAEGRVLRPEDRDIIIHSYQCEFFGYTIDWLNNGMDEHAKARFLRLCQLRAGSTQEMLDRSRII
ncbi:MAG: TetR/AcrR family transcriptional regulator [Clostridia bacterium]|nr:TetR/AcrR family transcriptional regulator [Clostridia bacterium]